MTQAIDLTKGQKIDLVKGSTGAVLTNFCIGLNWGAIEKKVGGWLGFGSRTEVEAVDLDASAVVFDVNNRVIDTIYYGHLKSNTPGFITHSGDDRTGDTGGDDGMDNEIIHVDLSKAPPNVEKIGFVLVSFRQHDFATVPHAGLRLYDGTPSQVNEVVAKYNIQTDPKYSGKRAMMMGFLYRRAGTWKFQALGDATNDRDLGGVAHSLQRIIAAA